MADTKIQWTDKVWNPMAGCSKVSRGCDNCYALGFARRHQAMGTRGYEIRQLEEQVRTLQAEQKQLQLQSSDLQSINRIQTDAQKLNFVPSTNVTYLKDSDFALK